MGQKKIKKVLPPFTRFQRKLSIIKAKLFLPVNWPRATKNYLIGFIMGHVVFYPSSISLTYAWSFGSIAGACLIIQMLSGIFLSRLMASKTERIALRASNSLSAHHYQSILFLISHI